MKSVSSYRPSLSLCIYLGLIGLFCAWVLSMPLFPSQDGPFHLYYVNVMRDLLRHTPGVYSDTYYIGRYLPVYSLYYYGLIAFGSVFSLNTANQILVCIFFVVFGLGIRSLIRAVGGSVDWAPFLVLPIFINWPLMMGFVNYSLATGIACFALALWCRNSGKPGIGRRLGFLALLVAVIFTHPVPWLYLVGFIFFDLVLNFIRSRLPVASTAALPLRPFFWIDVSTAAMASLGLVFLSSFHNITGKDIATPPPEGPFLRATYGHFLQYRHGFGFMLFTDHGLTSSAHLWLMFLGLAALTVLALGTFVVAFRRQATAQITWSLFGLCFLVAWPFVPANLNGAMLFAVRLLVLLWVSLVVAASPMLTKPRLGVPLAAAFGALGCFILALMAIRVTPVAHQIDAMTKLPAPASNLPGAFLAPPAGTASPFTFDPTKLAGANYYREHHALMFNTNWLEQAHIPVKMRPEQLHRFDPTYNFVALADESLSGTPTSSDAVVFPKIGYAVGMIGHDAGHVNSVGTGLASKSAWRCSDTDSWRFCTPAKQQ